MSINTKSPLPRLKFDELNYLSYCRFLELLHDDNVNCKFILTSKENYINSIINRGITTEMNDNRFRMPYVITGNHKVILDGQKKEICLKAQRKFSKFVPYFKVQSFILLPTCTLTKDLIPKTFKYLEVKNIKTVADVNKAFDLCYHENIKYLTTSVLNDRTIKFHSSEIDVFYLIEYLMNKMPVEQYFIEIFIKTEGILDYLRNLKKHKKVNEITLSKYNRPLDTENEFKWVRQDSGDGIVTNRLYW